MTASASSVRRRISIVEVWLLLAIAKCALRVNRLETVRRLLRLLPCGACHTGDVDRQLDCVARSISRASQWLRTTCLERALVAESIASRCGYAASLRIGVRMSAPNRVEAHAWVAHGARVVVGDDAALHAYVVLVDFATLPGSSDAMDGAAL